MQRRVFLAGGVAAGIGASLPHLSPRPVAGQQPAASEPEPEASSTATPDFAHLEIIDCHTHFYDPTRKEGVPWPSADSPLYRPVYPKDLRAQKQFRPVTGTVVVEASAWIEDNAWLLDLAKEDPFLVGIVGRLYPGEKGFAEQLKRFAANPLYRGIRVLVDPLKASLDRNELDDYRRLAEADLCVDVNGGPEMPSVVAELAKRVPDLRIAINHIANVRIDANEPPREWAENIRAAAERPNVSCKISGLVEGAGQGGKPAPEDPAFYRPYIDVVWNAFGDDRVIYGSNWPVCEVAADYFTTQRISLAYAFDKGEAATRKFCSENAKKVYKWVDREGRKPA
jgi:predicted TIM-barrel fold metal-dependent hydrolase